MDLVKLRAKVDQVKSSVFLGRLRIEALVQKYTKTLFTKNGSFDELAYSEILEDMVHIEQRDSATIRTFVTVCSILMAISLKYEAQEIPENIKQKIKALFNTISRLCPIGAASTDADNLAYEKISMLIIVEQMRNLGEIIGKRYTEEYLPQSLES